MTDSLSRLRLRLRQLRPTAAESRNTLSMRARLMLLVALTVTAVIGAVTYLEVQTFESGLERDLREAAHSVALAIADDLEIRDQADAASTGRMLHEFMEATPPLRAITVLQVDESGGHVFASTSSDVRSEALALGRRVVERQDAVWLDDAPLLPRLGVPVARDGRPFGAVVVTVSLGSIAQIHARGRIVALLAAPLVIVAVTLLVHLLVQRFIHTPIAAILDTMQRAGGGDFSARTPSTRHDEIGTIAERLNAMLKEMQGFHVALQERVREATEELRQRNTELVESSNRTLALREALARGEQMAAIGHMAANVAHQIGTPLNLISGYVQMTMEQTDLDSRVRERLQMVQEQISAVTAVVRMLLDRARRPALSQLVDPGELVKRVCDFARPRLNAAGVRVTLDIGHPLPVVKADAVQLELALLSVVSNALDAMPAGGVLAVAVRTTDRDLYIEVDDSGQGIDPVLLPHIFEPWVTTKAAGDGTGLGLSIARDVITTHGGSITVCNKPEGGAMVRIELPRAAEADTAAQVSRPS